MVETAKPKEPEKARDALKSVKMSQEAQAGIVPTDNCHYKGERLGRCRLVGGVAVVNGEGSGLLTEQEVSRSWQKLLHTSNIASDAFEKAEALLDELRAESPLRHRLETELNELRKLRRAKQPV